MFVLRPSSPLGPAQAAPRVFEPHIAPKPALSPEPFIDEGLPLPESYDTDIVRALLQDPFRVLIYWEVRERSLRSLTRYFSPEDAQTFRVVLKLTELEGGAEAFFEVGARGRYWMLVFPDRTYEFEIGVRSPVHGHITLVRSNRVRTPRGTVSPHSPPDEHYRMDAPAFLQVLEASGFAAEQTMTITAAAAQRVHEEANTLEAILERLPDALRNAVLIAAAGGGLTRELIDALPEPLRSELLKLFYASGGELAAVGLMHYLPEFIRELTEDDLDWLGGRLHPFHMAPRFFIGGTENLSWPGAELRWPGLPRRPSSLDLIAAR